MMIVVTGGAGFIGSNLVSALNRAGYDDVVVVDNLTNGRKFSNISSLQIGDYLDKQDFIHRVRAGTFPLGQVEAVFHLGACSATTEWNGRYVMENNYRYTVDLFEAAQAASVPLIYASSAAVYGGADTFAELPTNEHPLNVYGYSKLLFDQILRRRFAAQTVTAQTVGLRFFNVYGPREQHKGSMASVAYHLHKQLQAGDTVKIFAGSDGYGPGEQRRDFVHVDDVVAAMLWFKDNGKVSGIFNIGTGASASFNEVANAVLAHHGRGSIEYIQFPAHLVGAYQSHTEADIARLRASGCDVAFRGVTQGVRDYLAWLDADVE